MPDGTWVTLTEAARRLDRAPDTLRKKAKRGKLEHPTRQDNHGQWLMLLPDEPAMPDGDAGQAATDAPVIPDGDAGNAGRVSEREARIADLEERLAAAEGERLEMAALRERAAQQEARIAGLRAGLADARAERDRLLALVEQMAAERRTLARRPWPGLRAWAIRLWRGEG